MPVKIGAIEPMSEEEFDALRRQKGRRTDPAMRELLDEVAAGRAVRVPLGEGQGARGVRIAIGKAASSRGLGVETVEGDGFVGAKLADEPRVRKARPGAAEEGQRKRGRPRRRQDQDGAEIASLQDLAAGES